MQQLVPMSPCGVAIMIFPAPVYLHGRYQCPYPFSGRPPPQAKGQTTDDTCDTA